MAQGKYPFRPRFPRLGRFVFVVLRKVFKVYGEAAGLYASESRRAVEIGKELEVRLGRGRSVYLIGICAGAHDTGACLVEVTATAGPQILANHEEDRIRATKDVGGFPVGSVRALRKEFEKREIAQEDLLCVLVTYDYCTVMAKGIGAWAGETPGNLAPLRDVITKREFDVMFTGFHTANDFQREWGCDERVPVLGVPHHDAHAWLSYGASPFAEREKQTLVIVIDAMGDKSSISVYVGRGDKVELLYENHSAWDSLGFYYAAMSAALGGWPMGSAEGRCMGAAAWGNMNRETNPYYESLREVLRLETGGKVFLNREWANWQRGGYTEPFTAKLKELLGEPLRPVDYWNPAKVLDFEAGRMSPEVQVRVDKIAAVQMVFEDAVFHLVDGWIREVRTDQVVLTGGASLNCVANGKMHEQFGAEYFRNVLGMESSGIKLWVPSFPGDAGVQVGAAYAFGVQHGGALGNPVPDPYQSGGGVTSEELGVAIEEYEGFRWRRVTNVNEPEGRRSVSELVVRMIAEGVVVGLFQGAAELGLRSLGHRSILANPFKESSREILNRYVKSREMFRPFAPMLTIAAVEEFFEVPDGIRDEGYEALRYMGVTLTAKGDAAKRIPAVCNRDGTARVQVVRESDDPIAYAILKAMGATFGAEVILNTSLNVGTPIALTLEQALSTLNRAGGWVTLVVITEEGEAYLVWKKRFLELEAVPVNPGAIVEEWEKNR